MRGNKNKGIVKVLGIGLTAAVLVSKGQQPSAPEDYIEVEQ